MARRVRESNDAEINCVCVKVTYIVQGVGSCVNAIGQQARDALKIKAERGLRTRHGARRPASRRSRPWTVHPNRRLRMSSARTAPGCAKPATVLGFPPRVRLDDAIMLYRQN